MSSNSLVNFEENNSYPLWEPILSKTTANARRSTAFLARRWWWWGGGGAVSKSRTYGSYMSKQRANLLGFGSNIGF